MTDLHFLPYVRRGVARSVGTVDVGFGPLPTGTVSASLDVDGIAAGVDVDVLGPDAVDAIVATEVLRRYPTPDSTGAEVNYFALLELVAADLPWRFTPALADGDGRLRPWIALVVVDDDDGGAIFERTTQGPDRLTVSGSEREGLPNLDESWAWVHVQSTIPAADLGAETAAQPGVTAARLVAPRRLDPARTYRACLVRTFERDDDGDLHPAWTHRDTDTVTLAVYDSWRFSTADEPVDFELLCDRLVPATAVDSLGLGSVDVTDVGIDIEWGLPTPVINILGGALWDPDAAITAAPVGTNAFRDAVRPLVDDAAERLDDPPSTGRYDPLDDDPVVGLPMYGQHHADEDALPPTGWMLWLNTRTDRRIAAGLGAEVVRQNQEELMAAAWQQVGDVRAANDELNRSRLAAEIGRTWQRRLAEVEDGDIVTVGNPLLTFIEVGGEPALTVLRRSAAPSAITHLAWLRRTPRTSGTKPATAMLEASSGSSGFDRSLNYQIVDVPAGCFVVVDDSESPAPDFETMLPVEIRDGLISAGLSDRLDVIDQLAAQPTVRRGSVSERWRGMQKPIIGSWVRAIPRLEKSPLLIDRPADGPSTIPVVTASADASQLAAAVTSVSLLDQQRLSVVSKIPALAPVLGADELPCAVRIGPVFDDALYWDLVTIDPELVLPGVADFPLDGVRLVTVNEGFVASFLVGANHEMNRELRWREYPADLGSTCFRRFFDHLDGTDDIAPIETWPTGATLDSQVGDEGTMSVIVVRSELVRRYPEMHVFVAPQAEGAPVMSEAVSPSVEGRLGGDIRFYGFDVTPEVLRGQTGPPEWFVGFEERVVAPRFGMDLGAAKSLTSWSQLTWDHATPELHVSATQLVDGTAPTLGDVTWGFNGAHQAAAVHQAPFRRLFPATTLVPS